MRHLEMDKEMRGEPIIFIPGIGGFAESYLGNFQAVYDAGYWPIAVDNLGFGGSGRVESDELSLTLFSEAIVSWIKELDLIRVNIVGNSFGAGVAMGLLEFIPEKINSMILVSPSGFDKGLWLPYRIASLPLLSDLIVRLVINKWIGKRGRNSWKSIVYDPEAIPWSIVAAGEKYKADHTIRTAYQYILRHYVSSKGQKPIVVQLIHQLAKKIKENNVPTLLIWGQNDEIIPKGHAVIAQEITGGDVLYFENCGHMAYLEQPEKFNNSLLNFLEAT